jgi:hypothetical protein
MQLHPLQIMQIDFNRLHGCVCGPLAAQLLAEEVAEDRLTDQRGRLNAPGLLVNAYCPGRIVTDMLRGVGRKRCSLIFPLRFSCMHSELTRSPSWKDSKIKKSVSLG